MDSNEEWTSSASDDASSNEVTDNEVNQLLRAVAHAPPQGPPIVAEPGTRWGEAGRYVIKEKVGRGGMGTVYAAKDTLLGRDVALKVIDAGEADDDDRLRLLAEAQLAASFEHERIARVYDVGAHAGFAFVAMEYVRGVTLRRWMKGRVLTAEEIAAVGIQIAEGLAELHEHGVVHRDLKPENVMLTAQGKVKLLDFGLARRARRPLRASTSSSSSEATEAASVQRLAGTPGYMAPEQCAGERDSPRFDVFALGVTIHELVTGERPFRGVTDHAIVHAMGTQTVSFDGDAWDRLPTAFRDATARMLARDPAQRFEDGNAALQALYEATPDTSPRLQIRPSDGGELAHADTLPAASASPRRGGSWRRRAAIAGAALAAAIGVAAARRSDAIEGFVAPPPLVPPGMVLIDVGTIAVGHDVAEIDRECAEIGPRCNRDVMLREIPRTTVTVPPFFIDADEVTADRFAAFLNDNTATLTVLQDEDEHVPRYVRRSAGLGPQDILVDLDGPWGTIELREGHFRARAGREKQPVNQVTWYGADAFCAWRGARLATEDEWEAAARGASNRRFPWGGDAPTCEGVAIPNDGRIPMVGACPSEVGVRAVGTSPGDVTLEGVRDLGGNVAEWTSSILIAGDRGARAAGEPANALRIFRGGSWMTSIRARTSGRASRASRARR